ncbi:glucose 1-dehydrogenase [Phenylobacterium sp. LjRoot219]|uniref:SDR family NAD(P)-dependent oxidoreductase n=1 Tax=Phenylobacterium sp. LjRoot219 TaxID=3342283 RepID=UPI003ECD444D
MSLFDLSGKVAAITGATKGIGLGLAQEMAAQGAKVVISSRDGAACDEVAADLNTRYGRAEIIAKGLACDLDDLQQVEAFAAEAPKQFGALDILVCNAAILPFVGPSAQTPPDLFDRILTRNIHHNFRLCQGVRPAIAARGGGSIVLIGSEAGLTASPLALAYGVAKAGVAHMALCLADEMAGEKIRVNCVAPGLIRSHSSTQALGADRLDAAAQRMPLHRVGEPRDIAGAVIYLASRAGSHVTGQTILVDGGRSSLTQRRHESGLDQIESGKTYN